MEDRTVKNLDLDLSRKTYISHISDPKGIGLGVIQIPIPAYSVPPNIALNHRAIYVHQNNIKLQLGKPSKKKIAEKETLVHTGGRGVK